YVVMRTSGSLPQLPMAVALSGAAEKAVSRQNEFVQRTQPLGETAYAAFDYSPGQEAVGSRPSPSCPQGFFSSGSASVSHPAGVEARASSLADQTFALLLESQGAPLGRDA